MITDRSLKVCTDQLWDVFTDLFNSLLIQHKVPKLGKESIVGPVAKNKHPKELNNLRAVALTSILMKVFVQLVKQFLADKVQGLLNPLQFAY